MKKIRIFISAIFFVVLLLICNNVKATNITVSPSEPKVGDEVTITISVPNVHTSSVTANISGVVSGKIKVVGGDLAGNASNYSNSAKFKCDREGKINIEITSDSSAVLNGQYVNVAAQKSINVSKASTNNSNQSNNSNSGSNSNASSTTQQQTKSNVATLANLGIKGQYDFTGFRASKTSYSVTVPNEAESVEIYASKGQSGQKITGTGVKQLKEGTNAINVVVTAEDGTTTKTYTINIERKSAETTDNKEENTEEQPEETSTEEEETFGLKDLKIDGLELTPEFKTDVYKYSAELKENKSSLELTTIATEENAEIEVTGNEDLKDGENIITVIVKEKDTDKTATYQITVNKIKEETNITEATVNNIDNKTKEMIILGIGILAIIIVVIIIVIVNKKRNSNNGQEYYYSELYNNDESEENINEENQDEQEEYDEEIEEKKKKKHSKGKRFK